MEEIGIVKSVEGMMARVVVGRMSGCCDHCEKDACDIPDEGVETEAINEVRATVGQKVKIVMKPYAYIKGALLIYVLPIFSLFAGGFLGKTYLPVYINNINSDLLAAIGGFIAFFASLIPVKILSNRMERRTEYKSVIVEILE